MAEFNAMDTAAFKGVWVFCEQREGQVQAISYQLLSEGRKLANDLGVELCGVVMGSEVNEDYLKALGGYGADRVYYIEISLRGRVLPIGGLREKLLAARRSGIKKVLMPHDNEKDLKEVPAEVLEDLEIVFVDHVDEVLPHALAASVEEIFSGRATARPLYLSLRAGKNDKDSSAAAPQ